MISSEKSEIPNKRGLLRVMLLFFCIAYQVIHGIVIIMRMFVSCDNRHEILSCLWSAYMRGEFSLLRGQRVVSRG